jgi:hypothetical protein
MKLTWGFGQPDKGRLLIGKAARKVAPPAGGTSARIEAETMTIVSGWSVKASAAPSGGYWLQGGAVGVESVAQLTHALGNGVYDIAVVHYDESDGQGGTALYRNGQLLDSWTWNVDADQGSGNATTASLVRRTIPNVTLANGDVIELRGTPHANEAMRVDYFDFTYKGA